MSKIRQDQHEQVAVNSLSELEAIRKTAARLGLELETSRPGDGRRRYDFMRPNGNGMMAIGRMEAKRVLWAYEAGRVDAKLESGKGRGQQQGQQ